MATVIRMPSVLANVTEGAIQSWLAIEGQALAVGDPLAEIETEKAVVEFAAEVEGTIGRLLVQPGNNLVVGTPIAVILAAGEGVDQIDSALMAAGVTVAADAGAAPVPPASAPAGSTSGQAQASVPVPVHATPSPEPPTPAPSAQSSERLFASPLARVFARERGIDLATIKGSGPGGRITRRDLEAGHTAPPAPSPVSAAPPTAPPTQDDAAFTDERLTGMRRVIARRLTESKTTVPHFYLAAHVKVDRLLALRAEINSNAQHKVSVNDLVLKAVAVALVHVPSANAIWNGDSIRRFKGVDLAVAVAVDGGLVTPVVRGIDAMTLGRLSATVGQLVERARAGRLEQHELKGGSFTVTNLGMYGVDEFSAILNPPQSGILAVSAAKKRPIVDQDGALAVASVMVVTLSADHRVIDGAVAAEWMAAFVRQVENPLGLLL